MKTRSNWKASFRHSSAKLVKITEHKSSLLAEFLRKMFFCCKISGANCKYKITRKNCAQGQKRECCNLQGGRQKPQSVYQPKETRESKLDICSLHQIFYNRKTFCAFTHATFTCKTLDIIDGWAQNKQS